MRCAKCKGIRDSVKDSRRDHDCIRRRRVCSSCKYIFHTIEVPEEVFDNLHKMEVKK